MYVLFSLCSRATRAPGAAVRASAPAPRARPPPSTPSASCRSSSVPAAAASRTGSSPSCFGELTLNCLAGELPDARGVLRQRLLDVLRLRRQRRAVDADAGALDVGEHRDQRHLELAIDLLELVGHEQRRQPVGQLPREVGALAGERQQRLRRDSRERRAPWRRGRTRLLRSAPCSQDARATIPRADGPGASRRAGSWRASSRTRARAARCRDARARAASNFRSCPTLRMDGSSSSGRSRSSAVAAVELRRERSRRTADRCRHLAPSWPSGNVARLTIARRERHADNRRPHRPTARSGMTRSANSPAARSSAISASSSAGGTHERVILLRCCPRSARSR